MTTWQKAPNDEGKLDYTVDWSDWLGSDTIASSTWSVPSDLTTVKQTIASPATSCTVWLTGGTLGSFHKITNFITTATSPERKTSRSFYIEVYRR